DLAVAYFPNVCLGDVERRAVPDHRAARATGLDDVVAGREQVLHDHLDWMCSTNVRKNVNAPSRPSYSPLQGSSGVCQTCMSSANSSCITFASRFFMAS